jgi:cytochrome c oxidase subunit 1
VTGKKMNELLGKIHFWPSFLFINGVFMPMFWQGLAGVSRRLYDGGQQYAHAQDVLWLNEVMSVSAWCLGLAQIPFIINFFWSMAKGKRVADNHWQATTLEWAAAPSPPIPHGNFAQVPTVVRGPYEYSVPEAPAAYLTQNGDADEEAA